MEELVVKIPFCEGMKVDRTLKELKYLKKRIEIPKKGFINRKKTVKEIQKKKKRKKIYSEFIDFLELTKKLKGKVVKKEFHYWETEEDGSEGNYATFIVCFPCTEKKQKFEDIFFDIYPELHPKQLNN